MEIGSGSQITPSLFIYCILLYCVRLQVIGTFPYIARTRPGTDFPTRSEKLLSQTEGQWRDGGEGVDDDDAAEIDDEGDVVKSELERRVTVREVLKYSRTWVITPSVTVQAWTQAIEPLWSQPSARTVEPKDAKARGSKTNDSSDETPVSKRIINWWEGGPWNHHSRSAARSRWTVSTSREPKASYRARTTLWLVASTSSRISGELASSGRDSGELITRERVISGERNGRKRKLWETR